MINNKSYQLDLGNGLCWDISACDVLDKWLDKLAYILRLDPAGTNNRRDKFFFCEMGDFPRVREWYHAEYRDLNSGRNTTDWFPNNNNKNMRIWFNNTISDVIVEIDNNGSHDIDIVNMWHSLHIIFQRVQDGGGLPLHAALLELEGKGIVLAARGGTGKSTSCRRLPGYWRPLSDDETFVVYGPENRYRAHPFPTWSEYLWKSSDKSWNVQHSVPLRVLFFLEQAESDEVIPLGAGQAAVSLNQSAAQASIKFRRGLDDEAKRHSAKLQFDYACNMAKSIPAFTLRASLYGRFWEEIEKTLVNI
jgi:SynChlorMet cassette protein ScmC